MVTPSPTRRQLIEHVIYKEIIIMSHVNIIAFAEKPAQLLST